MGSGKWKTRDLQVNDAEQRLPAQTAVDRGAVLVQYLCGCLQTDTDT